MITVPQHLMDQVYQHGEDTYPEECCGVLIADPEEPEMVIEIRRMRNINAGSRNTRYNIDPMDLLKLEDELDERGLAMIAIYHSHPDHPARPSEYDRDHAWPNISYLVMRTANGRTEKITSWRLNDSREFMQEPINLLEELQ